MYEGLRQIFGPLIRNKIKEVVDEEYLPAQPPFILSANHVGFLDAPFLTVFMLEKFGQPVYAPTTMHMIKAWGGERVARRWLGMLAVHPEQKSAVLDGAVELLRKKNIVIIFPEGTRNAGLGQLGKGKTGAVRLALSSGVPLIPVGLISNTGHRIGAAFKSFFQSSRYVKIIFGPAVDLSEFHGKPIDRPLLEAATRKLMREIGDLCGKPYPF